MAEMTVLNNVMVTSAKKRKPGLLSRCLSVVNKSTAKALVKYVAAPLALYLVALGVAQA
ncbi:TPA: conjugal transfer protein TraA, partial [Escherichia coli]|nr:conjugal transfer protein TraA [Escherichia coli]HAP0245937.1 conjugal transfer protein TraA [Escherichia coli]